jgi:rSAM/selenodomain-associated transferase 1
MGRAAISCRVLVFAKAPTPGQVKTRLIPVLGEGAAAELHRKLVDRTLRTALAAAVGPVELWCAPDAHDEFFFDCARQFGIGLREQGAGDLGARMARALDTALAEGTPALLIGCDCPALTPDYLREAAATLARGYDAVIGPAEDGGYVLIGIARGPSTPLFEGVAWSTPQVMQQTRARLASLAWRWCELATLWDVDRPQDLSRLAQLDAECYPHAARLNLD